MQPELLPDLHDPVSDALRFYELMQSQAGSTVVLDLPCGFCGLTYREFMQTGLVGCACCFDCFQPTIVAALSVLHARDWPVSPSA